MRPAKGAVSTRLNVLGRFKHGPASVRPEEAEEVGQGPDESDEALTPDKRTQR